MAQTFLMKLVKNLVQLYVVKLNRVFIEKISLGVEKVGKGYVENVIPITAFTYLKVLDKNLKRQPKEKELAKRMQMRF